MTTAGVNGGTKGATGGTTGGNKPNGGETRTEPGNTGGTTTGGITLGAIPGKTGGILAIGKGVLNAIGGTGEGIVGTPITGGIKTPGGMKLGPTTNACFFIAGPGNSPLNPLTTLTGVGKRGANGGATKRYFGGTVPDFTTNV